MSGSLKLGLIIIVGVLTAGFAVGLIRSLLGFLIPVGVIVGIGLIVYGLVERKALGGRKRRYLP
ncbi:MAG: hypothetical protein ABL949_01900 [Fimbriimonadaceae bacterium]